MIRIEKLEKSYDNLKVLNDVNLNIRCGEIFGIIGRSGTGKSTLLRCINGLETYDAGSLIVNGVQVKSLSENDALMFRKNVGMIFQQFSLLNRLSIYDNIALPLKCWKYPKHNINQKVKALAEIVGISEKLNVKPRELSGGQKQRAAIARALAMDPKIILCDEATSALDPRTAKSIINLLKKINKEIGITIVVVTHQMSVLRSCCENIAIMENGHIAVTGNIKDIFLKQPEALKNIIGQSDVTLPTEGVNIRILVENAHSKSILTNLARDTSVDFIILGGGMDTYQDIVLGSVIINVPHSNVEEIRRYLSEHKVCWHLA